MSQSVGLLLGCALMVMGTMPPAPTLLTVSNRAGDVIAECSMQPAKPPTPRPKPTVAPRPTPDKDDSVSFITSDLALTDFYMPKRWDVSDCKLKNGATWDQVMDEMANAFGASR